MCDSHSCISSRVQIDCFCRQVYVAIYNFFFWKGCVSATLTILPGSVYCCIVNFFFTKPLLFSGESFQPDMYDQLHLYGNEADEASHDYESPVRAHTIGGAPTVLNSKAKQTFPSTKSEGHQAAMYQNKSDVSNKVRVFERLASQEQTPGEMMVYSDVRYWTEFYLCMGVLISCIKNMTRWIPYECHIVFFKDYWVLSKKQVKVLLKCTDIEIRASLLVFG